MIIFCLPCVYVAVNVVVRQHNQSIIMAADVTNKMSLTMLVICAYALIQSTNGGGTEYETFSLGKFTLYEYPSGNPFEQSLCGCNQSSTALACSHLSLELEAEIDAQDLSAACPGLRSMSGLRIEQSIVPFPACYSFSFKNFFSSSSFLYYALCLFFLFLHLQLHPQLQLLHLQLLHLQLHR